MPARDNVTPTDRLKSRREIAHLFKDGHKCCGGSFNLLWREADQFRYAVLVSRRHGIAVRRNRIKRVYREAVRLNRNTLMRPLHIAVLPSISAGEPNFSEIHERIGRIFKRLNNPGA